jgi:asparagine synthase (glutamine-hydrolysing)
MCGISGIISFKKNEEHIRHIFEMHARMQHRGPDDDGFAFFSENEFLTLPGKNTPGNVRQSHLNYAPVNSPGDVSPDHNIALAHNRLSVIDISYHGHQPMCEENAQYWIVYNGEIYNYPELREELSMAGYNFRTNTDTEVVLKAYMEWGADCIHRFNGMWAFVIYDRKQRKVFASRDRFGVKPFYYILNSEVFAFASEQKALYHFPDMADGLNRDAVFDYLAMGKLELEPEGLVEGIMELPPAHLLNIDLRANLTEMRRYYKLEYTDEWGKYSAASETEYIEQLREQLREAIRIRLNSDVPVGTCLSGGIDSSILVSIVNQLLNELKLEQLGGRQKTFTASYDNELIDESKYAEMLVKQTGAEWHQVFPTAKEMLSEFEKIVRAQDIPFLSSSTYSQFKVMELAGKNGVTVTLDGQGADELLGGYAPHYSSYMMHALKRMDLPSFISGTANMKGNFSNWGMITRFPLKFQLAKTFKHSFFRSGYKKGKPETDYIPLEFWNTYNKRLEILFEKYGSNFNAFLSSQFQGDEFKNLMRTGDRNAMAFSIESRMPFADDINMIESIFNIPAVYKIRKGYSKSLLRKAAAGQIPDAILQRRDKVGFATPERIWFNEAGQELRDMLLEQDDEYVNWKKLSTDWDALLKDPNSTTARLWRFVNFAVWRKTFDL